MSRIAERQQLRDKLGEVSVLAAGKSIKKIDKYAQDLHRVLALPVHRHR